MDTAFKEQLLGPPNLPRLQPSQTLYSWCGAVHRWNGNVDVRETSRQLFGAPYAGLLHDFPSHLDALDERTSHRMGSVRPLALTHTLLGYFLATATEETARRILELAHAGATTHLKMLLGVPASRVGGFHPLKDCPACSGEAESACGYAYWRVEHQFPSTLVCIKHGRPLRILEGSTSPVHRRRWIAPSDEMNSWRNVAVETDRQLDQLRRLADFSTQLATMPPASLNPVGLSVAYRGAMRERGLIGGANSLRVGALVDLFRAQYSELVDMPGFAPLRAIRTDWPGLAAELSRRRPSQGHPLKHVLMIALLFDSWDDFLVAYRDSNQTGAEDAQVQRDAERRASDDVRDQFLDLIRRERASVSAAARSVGVATSTGVRWAKRAGIAFVQRPKTWDEGRLQEVRRLLSTGLGKIEVQRQTGISAVSLNRLLSSEPKTSSDWYAAREAQARIEHRRAFAELIASHSGWPINAIRAIPGNGYAWLYRHDRAWLREHLPAIWSVADPS